MPALFRAKCQCGLEIPEILSDPPWPLAACKSCHWVGVDYSGNEAANRHCPKCTQVGIFPLKADESGNAICPRCESPRLNIEFDGFWD